MKIPNQIPESATVAIYTVALQKKVQGEEIFNFSAGEPNLPLHPEVAAGIQEALQSQGCSYPPLMGLLPLRQAVSAWMQTAYGCSYTPNQILVTCGGKFALYAALDQLLAPGDEVLIPSPFWPSYPTMVSHLHGVPVSVPCDPARGWKVTVEALQQYRSPKTKILIINHPNNPTGAVYTKEELEAILALADECNWTVISDEVYSELLYAEEAFVSCGSFPQRKDRVVVVQSCSKNFGLTGLRVGFALGPEELITAMRSLQGQTTTGTAGLSQWAAVSAVTHADRVGATVRDAMCQRRDLFVETLNRLFSCEILKPEGALYLFVPIKALTSEHVSSQQFCEKILAKGNIAAVPGSAFGMEGYVRFAFTESPAQIEKGLNALKRVCRP